MDSITQVLLGSAVAAGVAPKGYRKRAMLTGAVLGTLPDLDVFMHYASDVDNFTHHRGFSHSTDCVATGYPPDAGCLNCLRHPVILSVDSDADFFCFHFYYRPTLQLVVIGRRYSVFIFPAPALGK
ncbi:MAG: hypothetical protein CSA45_06465 [Gammaproteobacteria bacterium]|nr:MAG: hypothetical protein CSA45_06465 [Gammaproteobacteria bacterium]